MLVATRSFADRETGEHITAGRDHVIEGHELAQTEPGFIRAFRPLDRGYRVRSGLAPRRRSCVSRRRRAPRHGAAAARASRFAVSGSRSKRKIAAAASASPSSSARTSGSRASATDATGCSGGDRGLPRQLDPTRVAKRRQEEREERDQQERADAIARFYRASVEDACSGWGPTTSMELTERQRIARTRGGSLRRRCRPGPPRHPRRDRPGVHRHRAGARRARHPRRGRGDLDPARRRGGRPDRGPRSHLGRRGLRLGPRLPDRDAAAAPEHTRELMRAARRRAEALLDAHAELFERLVDALVERGSLDAEAITQLQEMQPA